MLPARSGLPSVSKFSSSMRRPFTPPALLTSSMYIWAARASSRANSAVGPTWVSSMPTLMDSCAGAAAGASRISAAANPAIPRSTRRAPRISGMAACSGYSQRSPRVVHCGLLPLCTAVSSLRSIRSRALFNAVSFRYSFRQGPAAAAELHDIARARVEAEVVLRGDVVDALGAHQVVGLLQRIAQRGTKLDRSGPGPGERLRQRVLQQDESVLRDGDVRAAGPGAIAGLVVRHHRRGHLLHRVVVGKLAGDEQRSQRKIDAFGAGPGDAQEVVPGNAVGVIHIALVAALAQRDLRQRRRGPQRGHENRVRIERYEPQHLSGDRLVLAVVALHPDQGDAVGRRQRLDGFEKTFS